MLILNNVSYIHPNKELLFDNINLAIHNQNKIALVGNNGVGKSTLLKIIAGELSISEGQLKVESPPYYVPQIFGQYNHLTIVQALNIESKLRALSEILKGNVSESNFGILNDDWTIEERCMDALNQWKLKDLNLQQQMGRLSGGEKTKVFLAGIAIHQPEFVLLDEPSNHLDAIGRELLYNFIQTTPSTLIVVSHDRKLLNQLEVVCELSNNGIAIFGGNYDFYVEQKQLENNALHQDINHKEKALRKAKEIQKETVARQQKLDSRGKGKQEKAGVSRIMMNTLRNSAEKSSSRLKGIHEQKIGGISRELQGLRKELPGTDKMKFDFEDATLHKGKILFTATNINFSYGTQLLWKENLNFEIRSNERISLQGANGSGKTTLIKIILGKIQPSIGAVYSAKTRSIYIDQDYSIIDNTLRVYEQAVQFNDSALQEHEIKIRLNRFLFTKEDWNKPCGALSGGEKMRLMLCCLTISKGSPEIIIMDEPTNNLDILNTEILTAAINEYQGTLIVVSHDTAFLDQVNVGRIIE